MHLQMLLVYACINICQHLQVFQGSWFTTARDWGDVDNHAVKSRMFSRLQPSSNFGGILLGTLTFAWVLHREKRVSKTF